MSASNNLSTNCSGLLLRSSFAILAARTRHLISVARMAAFSVASRLSNSSDILLRASYSRPHRSWVACCAHEVQSFDLSQTFWCLGFNEQISRGDEQNPGMWPAHSKPEDGIDIWRQFGELQLAIGHLPPRVLRMTCGELLQDGAIDAEWMVLSACNTIAGDKPGVEALSGLARAFFYAGAFRW